MKTGLGRLTWSVVIVCLSVAVAETLFKAGTLSMLDVRLQDSYFQWQGVRAVPTHVAIVAIDDATLSAFPDDPMVFWTPKYAHVVARLNEAGARVVGIDMLLSISPEQWLGTYGGGQGEVARDYDQGFRKMVNQGHLILASTRMGSGENESDYLLPSPDYLLALPELDIPGYVALADLFDEGDGVIRRFRVAPVDAMLRQGLAGSVPVLGLPSLLAVHAAGKDPAENQWQIGGHQVSKDQLPAPIPFFGPPGTFPRISMKRLLEEGAAQDPEVVALRGKVVLLGATAAGWNDDHFSPYATRFLSGRGPLMSGVELHANVAEALLSGDRLEPPSNNVRIATAVISTILVVTLFLRLSPGVCVATWLGTGLFFIAAGYMAFSHGVLISVTEYAVSHGIALLSVLGLRLMGEERERSRIRQIFGRYVSEQVVDALMKSDVRPELGGQTQAMTVLFSDIRNFTTISEQLSAKEVVEMLNTYFQRACAPLLDQGGSIDKFIGDAIMVEFGSPLPVDDHALRAVKAALALRNVARDFSQWLTDRFPERDLPPFAIGVGLHSGDAVIGNIGSSLRMEFTAIGDTVNLASRLEGMTKQLGCVILASESTITAAGPSVVCGRSEVVCVKGRKQSVRVFEVVDIGSGG